MKLIFKASVPETGDIHSFLFMPVKDLEWVAGQSIKIELTGPYGPLEHRFSISSAPHQKLVTITTRLSGSDYKNSLAALKMGDQVDGHSIEGDFIWHDHAHPHIFVAAGIGITPIHAILSQRASEQKPLDSSLIYSSRSTDILFQNQLDQWLQPTYVVGRRLSASDVPKTDGLIYISGPHAFVDQLSAALQKRGVPKDQLIHDFFTGHLSKQG